MREKKGALSGVVQRSERGHGKYKYKSINGPLSSTILNSPCVSCASSALTIDPLKKCARAHTHTTVPYLSLSLSLLLAPPHKKYAAHQTTTLLLLTRCTINTSASLRLSLCSSVCHNWHFAKLACRSSIFFSSSRTVFLPLILPS